MDASSLDPVPALGDVVAVRSCPVQAGPGIALPDEPLIGEHAQAFADDVAALPAFRAAVVLHGRQRGDAAVGAAGRDDLRRAAHDRQHDAGVQLRPRRR